MSTGDFPKGKEYNCPDCLLNNGHPDAMPQINFCASCRRKDNHATDNFYPKEWRNIGMNVYDVLRNKIYGFDVSRFRLSSGERWLVIDDRYGANGELEFVVYGK